MTDVVVEHLDATGVPYEIVPCDPDLADTAEFCEAYGYELTDSANTIVVVGKSEPRVYAACVVLADSRLDVNGVVRRRFGSRKASFASGEETMALTGMAIGGVTAAGLPPELPLWIDSRVMERERIVLGGGGRDRKIVGPPALLAALPLAEVVDGLAKVVSGPGPGA
jgi:prolyl-tRNA editing enzyme YbaK/EbsC (Cys-tRNA(Pro) deacylase)